MNDENFLEGQLFLEARYLLNWPMKMHRINAKKIFKIISSDFFHKIDNYFDFIAPLTLTPITDVCHKLIAITNQYS